MTPINFRKESDSLGELNVPVALSLEIINKLLRTIHVIIDNRTKLLPWFHKLGIHSDDDIQELCRQYIKGLQWVIQYYCMKIPSWSWYFPYLYAPFLYDLAKCTSYEHTPFSFSTPLKPLEQILAVVPPQGYGILPQKMQNIVTCECSPLSQYYPKQFEIDVSGKMAEWQGLFLKILLKLYLYTPGVSIWCQENLLSG